MTLAWVKIQREVGERKDEVLGQGNGQGQERVAVRVEVLLLVV